jgi:hypothetical protein
MEEKDALVRSWAFGIEKRSWRLTRSYLINVGVRI